MATHRSQDPAFAPDFAFQLTIGVLEAFEDLVARRRPITPSAVARQFRAQSSGARPTVTQIQAALAQVQRWRDQIITRDLLQHRRQLVTLCARIEVEQRRLSEDWVYLTRMLRETDALLHNTLTAPGGAESLSAPASAKESRPLQ